MKTKLHIALGLALLATLNSQLSTAHAQGTAFTYQGRLNDGASPANGSYDLTFALFSVSGGAGQVGGTLTSTATPVSNGLFTVTLDFGNQFPGADRWLEIGARTNGGATFTLLSPRQKLTPTPYALYAPQAGTATTAFGVTADAVSANGLQASSVTSAKIADGSVTAVDVNSASFSTTFWKVDGNAGANPTNGAFLGTTDYLPLEFRINGQRALRIEPATNGGWGYSPNILGGFQGNIISNGVVGAVIGGGGSFIYPNRAGNNFATVIGGMGNTASGLVSTAMGLRSMASGDYSTAMGDNTIASGGASTAMGDTTTASGDFSTAIGYRSTAGGISCVAMGYRAYANWSGSFVWSDYTDSNFGNTGNNQFLIRAAGGVGIGTNNPASALDVHGTVTATSFSGSGSGLTGLVASNLNGTVADARLSANVALRGGGNVFTGDQFLSNNLSFGQQTRQMLNLWGVEYGIGVQNSTVYFRTHDTAGVGNGFAWYRGGTHNDAAQNPGGGTTMMRLDGGGLTVNGTFVSSSDRNVKQDFAEVNRRAILEKVAQLPIQTWAYKDDPHTKHLGPVAQDFYAAFAVGPDDKHISMVDADGVALAAIQGLNEKVENGKRKAESRIEKLEAENAELKHELAEIKQLLVKLSARGN